MIRTLPMLASALALLVLVSLGLGTYPIPLATTARILGGFLWPGPMPSPPPWTEDQRIVVELIRLPRVLLAALAGAGLGLSGTVLQGLLRNPLVGPDIVGVSGGAACGGAFAILLGVPETQIVGFAFAGGLAAIGAAAALARSVPGVTLGIVLAGVIVGAFCGALLALIEYLADPVSGLPGIVYWLLGSFAGADRVKVSIVGMPLALGGALLVALRWRLNLLSLGAEEAQALGVSVGRLRWLMIALVALIVAAQVSVSGILGWVGLVVPHVARMLVGPDHRRLVPAAMLAGAIFMLAVDDLTRITPGSEIPVGLVAALIGTPVFALLFWRTQAGGWHDA